MSLTRLNLTPRARSGPQYADQVSPWDDRTSSMWSIVRGGEPTQYTKQGRTVREQGFESNAVVNACVRIIADQIATVRLQAYEESADGEVVLKPKGKLQQLLDQPAPQLPGFTYRRLVTTHAALYGNGYTIIRRATPNGPPVALRPLHPERLVQVLVDVESDEIIAYVWNDTSGKQHTSPWTDVIHVKDMIVEPDAWFGFPRGAAALGAMLTDGEASKYVRQVVTNSGIPALIMIADDGVGKEDLERAEDIWQEKMVTRGGRGRTRFVGGIKTVQVVGHSLSELEFPSLRGISREDICAAFGVDPRLVGAASAKGTESALSGGQYQEARRKLEQLTCAPLRTAIVDALDTTLTPEYGHEYVRFDPDAIGALTETPKEVADRVAVLVLNNIATLEEARRAVGLPEELDPTHHTAAGSLRTVKKAIELSELPPPAPVAALPGKAEPKQLEGKSRTAPKQITAHTEPTSRAIRGGATLTKAQRETLWRAADAKARALEPAFRDRAQALFAIELATVTQIVMDADDTRAAGAPLTRKSPSFYERVARAVASYYSPKGTAQDAWERGFTPDISLAIGEAGSAFATDIGVSFDLQNPRVIEAVRMRVNKLTGSVAQTTLKQLQVLIAAGREAGQDADQIARAIQAGVLDPAITAQRAQLIAETETMGALNEGEWLAAIDSGVMQSKGWLSQADGNVRETHVGCEDEGWIAIDAPFTNGLQYPHDPDGAAEEVIRCRCSLLFSDLPPDEAQLEQPHGESA
jgi:HK97 family phage portal protein